MASKFENQRTAIMNLIRETLENNGYEVLQTNTYEFSTPIVNEERDEGFCQIPVKIPKGSRDGDAFDGYALAEEYQMKCKAREEKKREKEREKEEKRIAREKAKAEKAKTAE